MKLGRPEFVSAVLAEVADCLNGLHEGGKEKELRDRIVAFYMACKMRVPDFQILPFEDGYLIVPLSEAALAHAQAKAGLAANA